MVKIKSIKPIAGSAIDTNTASEIFDQIALFAGYGFNKSHAAAYASVSFQTAYLRTHHPECYFAAAMNLELDDVKEIAPFASELKARNIMLWAPDVNMSTDIFRPIHLRRARQRRDFAVSYALTAMRGVGRQAARDIVAERAARGRFESVKDFMSRMGAKVNRKAALALVHAGAFDSISNNRADAAAEVDGSKKTLVAEGQMSMFDLIPELDTSEVHQEYDLDDKLDREFDVLGHYLSDHPLRLLRQSIFDNNQYFSKTILDPRRDPPRTAHMPAVVCDVDVRQTKKGDTMAVITLSDPDRTYEALAFKETWAEIKPMMRKKARLLLTMTVIAEGDERRLLVEDAKGLIEAGKQVSLAA